MSFIYSNPHPKKKMVPDCVKRALVHVTGEKYEDISLALNRFKKISGAKEFNDNENWKKFVEAKGWQKLSFPAIAGQPRMNGFRFCETHSTGRYLLRMAGHLSAVIDGNLLDTFDCREKCVYNAWRVQ